MTLKLLGRRVIQPPSLRAPVVFLLAFLVGVGLQWFIAPIQSPDENSHLARAYLISTGQMTLTTPPGLSSGGQLDTGLIRLFNIQHKLFWHSEVKQLPQDMTEIRSLHWTSQQAFYATPGTGYYLPVIYAPQALGFLLGKTVGLSVYQTYILIRLLTLLSVLALFYTAFRLVRPTPLILFVLLMPMSLFQVASPTIDGLTLGIVCLLLSLTVRAIQAGSVSRRTLTLIFLLCVLITTVRPNLLPICLLPVLIKDFRYRRIIVAGILGSGLLSMLWQYWAINHVVDIRKLEDNIPFVRALDYVTHPAAFFKQLSATLSDEVVSREYTLSFTGKLGWLDTPMQYGFNKFLWIFFRLQLLCSFDLHLSRYTGKYTAQHVNNYTEALSFTLVAIVSSLLVFFMLLVTWTPADSPVILGVQGRYFLHPALIFAYGMLLAPGPSLWQQTLSRSLLVASVLLTAVIMPLTLWHRYYG